MPKRRYTDIFGNLARAVLGALAQGVADLGGGNPFAVTAFIDATDGRLSATVESDGTRLYDDTAPTLVGQVIFASRAAYHTAGVVARTTEPDGSKAVQAWKLVDGHPLPLPASIAAQMCAVDVRTGKPQEPQRVIRYTNAFDIAPLLLRLP
ncbi:hypothetical protein AB0I84_40420 [Streptomyces spectabilis]|uniref:hypothetical protein n=1 Tax=Streptomyces spectabilis TaxID=68270 RepID=UPI0033DB822F